MDIYVQCGSLISSTHSSTYKSCIRNIITVCAFISSPMMLGDSCGVYEFLE